MDYIGGVWGCPGNCIGSRLIWCGSRTTLINGLLSTWYMSLAARKHLQATSEHYVFFRV